MLPLFLLLSKCSTVVLFHKGGEIRNHRHQPPARPVSLRPALGSSRAADKHLPRKQRGCVETRKADRVAHMPKAPHSKSPLTDEAFTELRRMLGRERYRRERERRLERMRERYRRDPEYRRRRREAAHGKKRSKQIS